MDSALSVIFGAVLAIGTTFFTNYLEHLRKKDYFLFGIEHEMNSFISLTNHLREGLLNRNKVTIDWLGSIAPTLVTKINKSRYTSDRNREWFLAIKSDELRLKMENFYWNTAEIISQYTYVNQEKNNLNNLRINLTNRIYTSGVTHADMIQQRLTTIIPIELGMIEGFENMLVHNLEELIKQQTTAEEIRISLKKEHTFLHSIKNSTRLFKCN